MKTQLLICEKCHRSTAVSLNARAWCLHDKPDSRFNPPLEMVPIEKVST